MTTRPGIHVQPLATGTAKAAAAGMPGRVRRNPDAGGFARQGAGSLGLIRAAASGSGGAAGWNDGTEDRAGCAEGCAVGA